jgi:hypothetical protein
MPWAQLGLGEFEFLRLGPGSVYIKHSLEMFLWPAESWHVSETIGSNSESAEQAHLEHSPRSALICGLEESC